MVGDRGKNSDVGPLFYQVNYGKLLEMNIFFTITVEELQIQDLPNKLFQTVGVALTMLSRPLHGMLTMLLRGSDMSSPCVSHISLISLSYLLYRSSSLTHSLYVDRLYCCSIWMLPMLVS
jgi:hypothetical protein